MYIYPFLLSLPPTPLPSHPCRSSLSTELSSLCYPAASHELSVSHKVVNVHQCSSIRDLTFSCVPSPSPHLCLYSCPENRVIGYQFSRFHIYALKYSVCFSLSELLHSLGQTLGSSTSLQMTQLRSSLCINPILFHIF